MNVRHDEAGLVGKMVVVWLLFLGVIAGAVLVMAIIQVAVIVFAARAARRFSDAVTRLEQGMAPIIASLQALSADAARATATAAAQVERADLLIVALRERIEQTMALVQEHFLRPARDLSALLQTLRDVFFGGGRRSTAGDPRRRPHAEEEDALFIG